MGLNEDTFRLGVIIVNWNTYEETAQCIQSILDHVTHHAHIVLVDNASEDGSGDKLNQTFPSVHYIKNIANLGFTGGNNVGIDFCISRGAEYLIMLNSDTICDHDFVSPMVQYLDAHQHAGAIQPLIYFYHDPKILWNAGTGFNSFLGMTWTVGEDEYDKGRYNEVKEVPWITGCCFMVRSSILREVGFLDDRYFMYYEDVDLSFRIRRSGYRLVFYPKVYIKHIAGVSEKLSNKSQEGQLSPHFHYYNIRNQLYVLLEHTKWYHLMLSLPIFLAKIALYCGYFIVRMRFVKLANLLKGVIDGFRYSSAT